MPGGLEGARIVTYEAAGARFVGAWRESADAVRMEVGMLADGLPLLEPDFTLRLMNDLAERATRRGVRFEINGSLVNDSTRRWLDEIGASHIALPGGAPTVTPAFPLRGVAPAPAITFVDQDAAIRYGESIWKVPPNAEVADVYRNPGLVGMSQPEMEALNSYSNGHYTYLNGKLRNTPTWKAEALDFAGWETPEEVDNWIGLIDGVLGRQAVPEDIVVWRGISSSGLRGLKPDAAIGKTFTEPGYLSTSLGPMPDLDRTFSGIDYDMHLRLEVPAGTPGYYTRNLSAFKDEQELLLARGLDYQVTAVSKIGDETIIDARIIAKAPAPEAAPAAPLRGVAPEPPVDIPAGLSWAEEFQKGTTSPYGPHIYSYRSDGRKAIPFYLDGTSKPLATATKGDYTSVIMSDGRMLTDGPRGPVIGGQWMDFPEEHWGLTDAQYKALPMPDRAALEANEQVTKYAADQYGARWLETYRPDVYDKHWFDEWGPLTYRGGDMDQLATDVAKATDMNSVIVATTPPPMTLESFAKMDIWKERKPTFAALPEEARDALADAPNTIQAAIHDLVGPLKIGPTGSTDEAITARVKQFRGVKIRDHEADLIEKMGHELRHAFSDMGIEDVTMRLTVLDVVDTVIAQEIETVSRTLGDHGARHLYGNARMGLDILKTVPGANTAENRAYVLLVAQLHDTGYLTPTARMFLDDDHGRWSQQFLTAHFDDRIRAMTGDNFMDGLAHDIHTHSSDFVDWAADPRGSAVRVADNLALFQKEKLPALMEFVPANVGVLIRMAEGTIDLDTARDLMRANILKRNLPQSITDQLMRAVDEVSPVLPKYTLGMLGATVGNFGWADDHLQVALLRGEANEALTKVVDVGQRQFVKFAESYGVDAKALAADGDFVFKRNGKTAISVDVQTLPGVARPDKRLLDEVVPAPKDPQAVDDATGSRPAGDRDRSRALPYRRARRCCAALLPSPRTTAGCTPRRGRATGRPWIVSTNWCRKTSTTRRCRPSSTALASPEQWTRRRSAPSTRPRATPTPRSRSTARCPRTSRASTPATGSPPRARTPRFTSTVRWVDRATSSAARHAPRTCTGTRTRSTSGVGTRSPVARTTSAARSRA